MKNISIQKNNKKIKIEVLEQANNLQSFDKVLIVSGPLGKVQYTLKSQIKNSPIFVNTKNLNFLIEKIKKLIQSVTVGWFVELNLNGIGYKSFKLNDKIALDLGYSNLILYKPTSLLKLKNFKNKIVLFSIQEEYLKDVAVKLRNYSYPNAYKGKGILFKNEVLKLKKKAKS